MAGAALVAVLMRCDMGAHGRQCFLGYPVDVAAKQFPEPLRVGRHRQELRLGRRLDLLRASRALNLAVLVGNGLVDVHTLGQRQKVIAFKSRRDVFDNSVDLSLRGDITVLVVERDDAAHALDALGDRRPVRTGSSNGRPIRHHPRKRCR